MWPRAPLLRGAAGMGAGFGPGSVGSHDMDEVLGTQPDQRIHTCRLTHGRPAGHWPNPISSGTGSTATSVFADRVRLIAYGDDKPDLAASEPVLAVCAGRHSVRLTIQRD